MTTESAPKAAPMSGASQSIDVAATVTRLRKTFASGRTRSIEWRKQQLAALPRLMQETEPAIAAALADDRDRNPVEAFIADIAVTTAEAKYAAKHLRSWTRRRYRLLEVSQLPGRGWVQYEPYGT